MIKLGPLLRAVIPKNRLGDSVYYYLQFIRAHSRFPKNVNSFNDALFKIKLSSYIESPIVAFVSDKELVKLFISAVVGDQYNVPTIAVLRSEQELRNYNIPPNSVVKPTQASGEVCFSDEFGYFDVDKIHSWFKLDYYSRSRERNYKNLRKKVIVEPLIFNNRDNLDYKFHCYKGCVTIVQVDFDRHGFHRRALYDRSFNKLPFSIGFPVLEHSLNKPENFSEMVRLSECLASYFDYVRVDMYSDGAHIFIGEITNVHGNAHESFYPPEAEKKYGHLFLFAK